MRKIGVRKMHGNFAVPGIIRDVTTSGEFLMLLTEREGRAECTDTVV